MSGMTSKGVEARAAEVKQAANRLHWEVEWARSEGTPMWQVQAALGPLAEALGILKNVMDKLDALIPDDAGILSNAKQDFQRTVAFYVDYHGITR